MRNRQFKSLTGGELLCQLLEAHNVEHIFGYIGGAALPLFDAIYKSTLFHCIVPHHEQGAGHMAEGYAAATLKPGIVIVTSGPGSSNLVTPLLNASLDGTPMVAICAQVSTAVRGTGAFQEIDMMGIARYCTKWSASVGKVGELPCIINEAFHQATSARPGPVLVVIPVDVAAATFDDTQMELSLSEPLKDSYHERMSEGEPIVIRDDDQAKMQNQLDKAIQLINHSARPVICAGHGVATSDQGPSLLSQISSKYKIPVMTTLMGLGSFDETRDLALHMVGTHGTPYANYAIQNADLILVLGARLDERVVGNSAAFALKAKEAGHAGKGGIIHFDVSPDTVGKVIEPTQVVVGDLSQSLPILLSRLDIQKNRDAWLYQIQLWKTQYALKVPTIEPLAHPTPQTVISELNLQTSSYKHRMVITTGVGHHQMWAAQRYRYKFPQSMITSGSLGTMGFGLPASIGAQIGRPDTTVIDIDGDASICMTMEELLTAKQYNVPIKIIVFNNGGQGMTAQIQRQSFGGRVCYNRPINPDFVMLAKSMGCESRRCESSVELAESIRWLLQRRDPALLDIVMDDIDMTPIVPAGKALELITLED
ncbi:Acetolactate synthase large subunit biosynthetic [Penicillium angulare]|uniref:Acetolactate synthase n=1 Tax=Penicillium angulare TaxID=116970 RepID=A0A9W9JTE0_9EURO|nr:Acetolactate synthase large subunit biosynthetic [Penicillium angulare]